MSTVHALVTADNRIILRNTTYSPDEVLEAALAYREAAYAADDDWDNGRRNHHTQVTAPARDEEGRRLEEITAPTLSWQEAMVLSDALMVAAANARRAELAVEVGASLDRASTWFRNNDRTEATR